MPIRFLLVKRRKKKKSSVRIPFGNFSLFIAAKKILKNSISEIKINIYEIAIVILC